MYIGIITYKAGNFTVKQLIILRLLSWLSGIIHLIDSIIQILSFGFLWGSFNLPLTIKRLEITHKFERENKRRDN